MTKFVSALCALAAGLSVGLTAQHANAEGGEVQAWFQQDGKGVDQAALFGSEEDGVTLASCNGSCGCDPCGCDPCSGGSCLAGAGGGSACRPQCYVGGELLYVRASFSQAHSYLEQNLGNQDPGFTYHQFDFDYDASFRGYAGIRLCECGWDLRFTYSQFNSDGSFTSPAQPTDGSQVFTAPFEVVTAGPGDRVFGDGSVEINNYDIGCSKTIPLGSPLGCCSDSCGDCCDPCGCGSGCGCGCWCPAWDITWTGAVRVANVDSELNYASEINSTQAPLERIGQSRVTFDGAGLRTGLLGRRYLGKQGFASVYMKGDISLLLGDVEQQATGTAFARHSLTTTQIVPVTELEAGGTVYLTRSASITGGYMFAAWHDLGHRAEYDFGVAGVQLESWDDANILGLDGFFVRGELAF